MRNWSPSKGSPGTAAASEALSSAARIAAPTLSPALFGKVPTIMTVSFGSPVTSIHFR
jgi:hypothetical protein